MSTPSTPSLSGSQTVYTPSRVRPFSVTTLPSSVRDSVGGHGKRTQGIGRTKEPWKTRYSPWGTCDIGEGARRDIDVTWSLGRTCALGERGVLRVYDSTKFSV